MKNKNQKKKINITINISTPPFTILILLYWSIYTVLVYFLFATKVRRYSKTSSEWPLSFWKKFGRRKEVLNITDIDGEN